MTNWDFPCSEPIDVSINNWLSGSVAVSGEPTSSIEVEIVAAHHRADIDELLAEVRVGFEDGRLFIHGPRHANYRRRDGMDLTIKVPAGSTCTARTASADVSCVGELGALTVQTASGDVTAATVTGELAANTASGDVMIRNAGAATIHTASGDVQMTRVDGDARINTASGDVSVGQCGGSVDVHTASGDIGLGAVSSGTVELISVSGDIDVAVVPGIGVYMDLVSTSGSIRPDLDSADGDESDAAVEIKCRTLSGDIRIFKARRTSSSNANNGQTTAVATTEE